MEEKKKELIRKLEQIAKAQRGNCCYQIADTISRAVKELSKTTEADRMQRVKDIITLKEINDFNSTWAYDEIKQAMGE